MILFFILLYLILSIFFLFVYRIQRKQIEYFKNENEILSVILETVVKGDGSHED